MGIVERLQKEESDLIKKNVKVWVIAAPAQKSNGKVYYAKLIQVTEHIEHKPEFWPYQVYWTDNINEASCEDEEKIRYIYTLGQINKVWNRGDEVELHLIQKRVK